jgi:hypothetical protein
MVYPSLEDEAGNVPVRGGGPVPLNVYPLELEDMAGGGVVELGNTPFKGGGPVPVMV